MSVKSYGFVDLEGAKVSAIIVEYEAEIDAASIDVGTYAITDYTTLLVEQSGFDAAIEMDYDGTPGNEGQIERVYVNDQPMPAAERAASGRYVIIEVNTAYTLSGQNLVYTESMIAGATQVKDIRTSDGRAIEAGTREIGNYTQSESSSSRGGQNNGGLGGRQGGQKGARGSGGGGAQGGGTRVSRRADVDKIILPEFGEGSGWTLNYIGAGAFQATHCYSEYTGQYEDFELPYSIYVPSVEVLEANRGNVSLLLHMERTRGQQRHRPHGSYHVIASGGPVDRRGLPG